MQELDALERYYRKLFYRIVSDNTITVDEKLEVLMLEGFSIERIMKLAGEEL